MLPLKIPASILEHFILSVEEDFWQPKVYRGKTRYPVTQSQVPACYQSI